MRERTWLEEFFGTGVAAGAYSARPTANGSRGLYIPTDGVTPYVDVGGTWKPLVAGRIGDPPPAASTWTAINAGGRASSLTDDPSGLLFEVTNGTVGYDARLRARPIPSARWRFSVHVRPQMPFNAISVVGIGCRASASGSIESFSYVLNAAGAGNESAFQRHRATADSNGASPTFTENGPGTVLVASPHLAAIASNGFWLQLEDDGTNRIARYSSDGKRWAHMQTVSRTDFLTADEYFLLVSYSSGNQYPVSGLFDSALPEAMP